MSSEKRSGLRDGMDEARMRMRLQDARSKALKERGFQFWLGSRSLECPSSEFLFSSEFGVYLV